MAVLSLKFRLDELTQEGRPFAGELPVETVEASVSGLVGALGYRAAEPLTIQGTVYRSAGGEVVVDGTFATHLGFDCVRCLEGRTLSVERRVDHVLVAADPEAEADPDEDPDVYHYTGEEVDVREMFREDLVLELPMNPLCESAGAACVERPMDDSAQEATIDPRWAPLLEMRKKMNPRS